LDVVTWDKPTIEREKDESYHTLKLPLENIVWFCSWEDFKQGISEISKVMAQFKLKSFPLIH